VSTEPQGADLAGVSRAAVQVRVSRGKGVAELVDGPADAVVVITVAETDATLDPTVAFMQGKLKATGHTGVLFEALRSGAARAAIERALASA
jgi:hypothetical protein